MTTATRPHVSVAVPGQDACVTYEYDETGLTAIRCGDRVHVASATDALGRRVRTYGDRLAEVVEHPTDRGFSRTVRAAGRTWTEDYRWDATGRLAHVDGVDVVRDGSGRVVACLDAGSGATWRYSYDARGMTRVERPGGARDVTRDDDGRAVSVRDAAGTRDAGRDGATPPPSWYRDALGRLWTVLGQDGRVRTTYLWDGLTCLGRIDGPVSDPLSAVFSVDPGRTPVRIVTRDGVTRVPRDAFGEALLAYEGVPGLFGGAVHRGVVHLPVRALDPVTGSFTTPDPFDGGASDPRRVGGYRGPLPTEAAPGGPYAVCGHDPVGRADPSGGVSAWLVLSDLTWSLQNNIVGWLGLDYTVNLVLSIGRLGDFFTYSDRGLSASPWLGGAGVLRGGTVAVLSGNIFTFQHLVYGPHADFLKEKEARVFVPRSAFVPSMLGSVLRVAPSDGRPFLLRGDPRNGMLPGWTRSGGPAVPVVPGSPVPSFPRGGLHFDTQRAGLYAPQPCRLSELVPDGAPVVGTLGTRTVVTVPGTSHRIAVGDLVLLRGTGPQVLVSDVVSVAERGGATSVRVRDEVTGLTAPLRLRLLSPRVSTEPLPKTAADRLDAAAATKTYVPGDALRLSSAGTVLGAATIKALEARLALAAPVDPAVGEGFVVFSGVLTGPLAPATVRGAREVEFQAASVPADRTAIRIVSAAGEVGAIVTGAGTGPNHRTVDVDLTSLGAVGTNVTWEPILQGGRLGVHGGAAEPDPVVTYEADAVARAPVNGYVVAATAAARCVRRVTARTHDVIVTEQSLPAAAGPFDVERHTLRPSPNVAGVTLRTEQLLATAPAITDPRVVALRMEQYTGAPDLASALGPPAVAGMTVTGTSVTAPAGAVTASAPPSGAAVALRPAAPGAALVPVAVRAVTVTAELDRAVDAASGLAAVPLAAVELGPTGPGYEARVVGPHSLTVLPRVRTSGMTTRLPRFGANECVEVDDAGTLRRYAVVAVDGTTLSLDTTGLPITMPVNQAVTVRRLVPQDPGNGSARLAVAGSVDPGNPRRVTWEVWHATALSPGTVLAVTDGTRTRAAEVAPAPAAIAWGLRLSTAPGDGAYDLHRAGAGATRYAASFTRDGAVLVPTDEEGNQLVAGNDLLVVTPYADRPASSVDGTLSSGGVKVPARPDSFEIDRYQSLLDHELTHTLQSATWGPLFYGYFPLFALEGILEALTDVEAPHMSPYVAAVLEDTPRGPALRVGNAGGVTFADGDDVEISAAGSPPARVNLTPSGESGLFLLDPNPRLPAGPVSVRRSNRTTGTQAWDVLLGISGSFTPGGVMNYLATVWAALFRGIYELGKRGVRALSPGDTYAGQVESGGAAIRLVDEAGRNGLRGAQWLLVQQGGATVVRSVAPGSDDAVKQLSSPVSFRDAVTVARHGRGTPGESGDWRDYYPAQVDAARPASLTLSPVGGGSLTLHVNDRVVVHLGSTTLDTVVTAASGATVELLHPVLTGPTGREVRIAKYDEADQMAWADSRGLEALGMGWMRWGTDPYGQLQYRTHPEPGSGVEWVLRVLRYAFGSQSWSMFLPPGRLFMDILFKHAADKPYNSRSEQEASENSGTNYSAAGRLFAPPAVPGDIGRYWYYPWYNDPSLVLRSRFDTPHGINLDGEQIVMPHVTAEIDGDTSLNHGATMAGTTGARPLGPGSAVSDELVVKAADPRQPDPPGAPGFAPSHRGFIPLSPETEVGSGSYVAFTEHGKHRVTIRDTTGGMPGESREAHDKGVQKLLFDVDIADVTVRVGGVRVVEAGTTTLTLVATQQAGVVVDIPSAASTAREAREWTLGTTRPGADPALRVTPDGRTLVARAPTPAAHRDWAEVARRYRPGPDGTYTSGGLAGQRVNLGGDVLVPIRMFEVTVVDTLKLRSAAAVDPADPTNNEVAFVRAGGRVFLVVPAAVVRPPTVVPVNYPTTATPVAPVIRALPAASVTGTLAEHVGAGAVYEVTFPATPVPASPVAVRFEVRTWVPGSAPTPADPAAVTATLTATIELRP